MYYFWNSLMGNVYYSNYDEALKALHAYAMAGHKVGELLYID